MTNKQTNTTELQLKQTTYDIQDDYYFTVINNYEINIRAYNETSIHLWIYNHNTETEIIDDELSSLEEVTMVLQKNLKLHINLPSIKQLLELQQRYKQGA